MANREICVSTDRQCAERNFVLPENDEQINELFAACLPRLQKAARKMLRNPEDCEDALQDGLLLAFRKLHQFEGRSSFFTWLYSIVRNTSRGHYRKNAAYQFVSIDPVSSDQEAHSESADFVEKRPSPEETCIRNERSQILRKATQEIPARYQPAIRSFYFEGLGEELTARQLHLTLGALKSQLHRSRRMLTSRIRKSHLARRRRFQ